MSVKVHEAVCLDSAQDRYFWFDHFLGDQLKDEWRSTGTGSAVVIDQQTGGIVRITTGAAINNSHNLGWNDIRSLHVNKKVTYETRVKLTTTSNLYTWLRLSFGANDLIQWYRTTGNWFIYCEDNNISTNFDSGVAPDTDYHIFRIECHTHGASHVHFYIDGIEVANSPISTNVPDDAGDYLQPAFTVQTKENATKSIDIDYVVIRQER